MRLNSGITQFCDQDLVFQLIFASIHSKCHNHYDKIAIKL